MTNKLSSIQRCIFINGRVRPQVKINVEHCWWYYWNMIVGWS